MCATDRLCTGFRKAEVFHLAFLNQLLHRARHIFDWYIGIHTMLIEQINRIDLESPERGLGDFFDALWPTVQARRPPHPPGVELWIEVEPEFGGDDYVPAKGRQRFAQEFFVGEGAVHFGGIKEGDAPFHGRPQERDHLLLVGWRTIGKAHRHAAEPKSRDFEVAVSQFALLHFLLNLWALRSPSLQCVTLGKLFAASSPIFFPIAVPTSVELRKCTPS